MAIGLSMGGLLCLHAAAQGMPPDAVVIMASPVWLKDKRTYLVPIIKYFKRYQQKNLDKVDSRRVVYDRNPLVCVESLLHLVKVVRRELPQVVVPSLFLQAKDDRVVNPKSAAYLYCNVGSRDKQLVWLERGGHILTMGESQEKVRQEVWTFLSRVVRSL